MWIDPEYLKGWFFFLYHELIFNYKSSFLRSCLTCRLVVGYSWAIWKQFKLGVCQNLQKSCKYWKSSHFMIVQHIVLISKIFCYNLLSKFLFVCVKRISCLCGQKRWEKNFWKIRSVYISKPYLKASSRYWLCDVRGIKMHLFWFIVI